MWIIVGQETIVLPIGAGGVFRVFLYCLPYNGISFLSPLCGRRLDINWNTLSKSC